MQQNMIFMCYDLVLLPSLAQDAKTMDFLIITLQFNRYLLLFSHYIERPLPHPAFSLQIHLMSLPFFYLSWFRISFTITHKVVEFSLSGYKSLHMTQVRAFTELTILLMSITYHLITEYHTCSEATHYMWLTCQINKWPWLQVDVSDGVQ